MSTLMNKIDFALVFRVDNANPNGDPLDGNRPRTTYEGKGEVSDVCLKRKIRNRLQDEGQNIFVQSDERRSDAYRSLRDRAENQEELVKCMKDIKANKKTREDYAKCACDVWYDVRAFGQVFAFKGSKKKEGEEGPDAVSIGVRGPVTIQSAFSLQPVNIVSNQITKSVNLETQADPDKKGRDTMGMKHRIDHGIYVTYGAINVQCAEKTNFSSEDADILKEALRTLFRNDATSARPDGSMEVLKLVWWKHNCPCGQYSSAKVHRTLLINPETGDITVNNLPGLVPEVIDGE